jgi:hypothetical protein
VIWFFLALKLVSRQRFRAEPFVDTLFLAFQDGKPFAGKIGDCLFGGDFFDGKPGNDSPYLLVTFGAGIQGLVVD